jgi:hypothetical protein
MEKLLIYLASLLEWMGKYRKWYKENVEDATKDDPIKKPPPPPPPH